MSFETAKIKPKKNLESLTKKPEPIEDFRRSFEKEISASIAGLKSKNNEPAIEKSFWGKIESVEEKIKKVEDLFNNLNTQELQREDVETHARGWNVTDNIKAIEGFKSNIIDSLSTNKSCLYEAPCFKQLISQKSYQDIIWIACNIDPEIFNRYEASARLNAFIQERPEFLESKEFKSVCLEQIKDGIKDGHIFEGYKHNQDFENKIPRNNKIDYFEEKDDWNIVKIEQNIFDKENKIKTKRKEIPNGEVKELIVNLNLYEYDSSQIDSLDKKEKDELRDVFLKRIKDYTFYNYSYDRIFGEEIISVGKKLGFTEEDLNEQIFDSMLKGALNKYPPKDGIDKEFPAVYQKLQETLTDKEKRTGILNSLQENIKIKDTSLHNWQESLDYLNINNEEKNVIVKAYLDFSSGDILNDKLHDIFGYSWRKEEDSHFSKEERLLAFSTMNPDQRSYILSEYQGSIDKISFLPFTRADILEFAVNSIKSHSSAYPSDIEEAQKKIQENFPNVIISNADIAKRVTFKNLDSIKDIEESLARNSVEMSPNEIMSQFSSPEDFVLKQIKGAKLYKLLALEEFRNNPETPELPRLPIELYTEIKNHILRYKKYYDNNDRPSLKELISFLPTQYKLSVLTDPELQESFSNYYADALRANNQPIINELGFLISKSESLHKAEQKVFEEYLREKDYFQLIIYYKTLSNSAASSPSISHIENIFKERIGHYGLDTKDIILNSNTLEKTIKDISLQQLNKLTPENLQSDELTEEWLNINYGADSKELLRVFKLIKNSKDFSYFDKEIKDYLFKGTLSEKFVDTLQDSAGKNPESIDRAVEFVKDMKRGFENQFIEENYDYLYKTLSKLDPEEYQEKVDLLQQIRPLLSSPLISKLSFKNLFAEVSSYNQENRKKFFDLIDTATYKINPENDLGWAKNTILYVNEVEEYGILHRDQNKKDKMVNLFSGDYKNTALREMTAEWKDFLKNDANFLPPQIRLVSKIIAEAGGAGNMKHIESLGNLISQIQSILDNKKTAGHTVQEIKGVLAVLEDRFSKEKWSQDGISEFYNLSKDILEAAPSLYTALGPIFENITSAKDMKKFMSDIFPFYQTQLVIQQNIDGDNITYNPRDLVAMRSAIKEFAGQLKQDKTEKTDIFESEKLRLLEIAKDGFKNRFGLLKIPEDFTKENLRSIQNTIRYMGNINNRTSERESLISLYLGLELDNKWGDFRGGKEIGFSEYISEKQLQAIAPLLEEKQKSYELLSEISGIGMDKMSKFQSLLQEDVSNNLIGDIQTIDIKLGNIKRNIDELVDPDIYQTQKEKDILNIFSAAGKNVNAVLSKLYGIATSKNIQLSEEDNNIKQKIKSVFAVNEWTPNKIKEIQDEIQPIGLVTSMVNKMQEEKVEENITELQARLIPNGQIIEIFNKLGEEFHQESGALALSKDLSYLENIVIKDAHKISGEEQEIVKNYLESVREKMKDLENVFDHIKQYFEKIKKSSHLESNPVLKSRIAEIEKVIYSQDTSSVITSQMTKDLNLIIENMRQCLGCMRKEINNDTNLSFGDYNKFFMMNQSEKEKGSISDEIVFFVPITLPDGSKEMSFVMDMVYGSKSSDILIGNISAVYKKYQVLKKEFPEARLSISVTDSTMSSVGLNNEILEKRLREALNKKIEIEAFKELNALIPKSSLSDNYVEFGKNASARQSGERQFSGLIIK